MPRRLRSAEQYTVGWIAPLYYERAAAEILLDDVHDTPEHFEQRSSDANAYTWGQMGEHNIVIASLPAGRGDLSAATETASDLVNSLPHIRIGLLVGIGAGVPGQSDVRLGDIVVSYPVGTSNGVVQYDWGKATVDKEEIWVRKGSLNAPPAVLLTALSKTQTDHVVHGSTVPEILRQGRRKLPPSQRVEWEHPGAASDRLFLPTYDHQDDQADSCDACDRSGEIGRPLRRSADPEIHYGTIASGNKVVKDPETRANIAKIAGKSCLCIEMEAAGLMQKFPCLVIRGICDYADSHKNDRWHRYAAAAAAAYAKELLSHVPVRQLRVSPRLLQTMDSISTDLRGMRRSARDRRNVTQNEKVWETLRLLTISSAAAFNSSEEDSNPTCLEGTRVDLLREIDLWARDRLSKPIFWLSGAAGTGKSTISRTVCSRLWDRGHLGGSFFFKRGEVDRGDFSKLFPTLAWQLANIHPDLTHRIAAGLDNDKDILNKGLRHQFRSLILDPLETAYDEGRVTGPVVLVMDALDESSQDHLIGAILPLLAEAGHSNLKVFITSRPDRAPNVGFRTIKDFHTNIVLHEIPETILTADLDLYLKVRLKAIGDEYNNRVDNGEASHGDDDQLPPDWPGDEIRKRLVQQAKPLFIAAATMCRFISERRLGGPQHLLNQLLQGAMRGRRSKLAGTYIPVLESLVKGLSDEDRAFVSQNFRAVLGTIIVLSSPLSLNALSQLTGKEKRSIDNLLSLLHSVVDVPRQATLPIRIFHLSFRDFLIDPHIHRIGDFRIDESATHHWLGTRCLDVMGSFLKQDMGGLGYYGLEGGNLPLDQVDSVLSAEVQYACANWVHHLELGRLYSTLPLRVKSFLKKHLLHWLEAMSLMRRVPDSLALLSQLLSLWQKPSPTDDNPTDLERADGLMVLLEDAHKFVQFNTAVISEAPLQLYSSCLLFSPESSAVRSTFKNDIPSWIEMRPDTNEVWDTTLYNLECDPGAGRLVRFSRDDTLILHVHDGAVCIARADNGAPVRKLHVGEEVVDACISEDSLLVATRNKTDAVCVWDIETGDCTHILSDNRNPAASRGSISAQALLAGWTRVGHDARSRVIFSRDASLVASCGRRDMVERLVQPHGRSVSHGVLDVAVWRVSSGELVGTLEIPQCYDYGIAFASKNILTVVAATERVCETWKFWDTEWNCGSKIQQNFIRDNERRPVDLIMANNGAIAVLFSEQDDKLWIWKPANGKWSYWKPSRKSSGWHRWKSSRWRLGRLKGVSGDGSCFVITRLRNSGRRLIEGLWLWDRRDKAWRLLHDVSGSQVGHVAFSYSLRVAAVIDGEYKVWNTTTGELINSLKHPGGETCTLSPTGKRFATVSETHLSSWWIDNKRYNYKPTWMQRIARLKHGYVASLKKAPWVSSSMWKPLALALSHDASIVALYLEDRIEICSVATGQALTAFAAQCNDRNIAHLAFSKDDSAIAAATRNGWIKVWRADGPVRRPIRSTIRDHQRSARWERWKLHRKEKFDENVEDIIFSDDGKVLAVLGETIAHFFGLSAEVMDGTIPKRSQMGLSAMIFTPDRSRVALFESGSRETAQSGEPMRRISMVDWVNGQVLWHRELSASALLLSLKFTDNFEIAVATTLDGGTVFFFQPGNGQLLGEASIDEDHRKLFSTRELQSYNGHTEKLRQAIEVGLLGNGLEGCNMRMEGSWILWNNTKVLWLPLDYRPRDHLARHDGRTFVYVTKSERLVRMVLEYPGPHRGAKMQEKSRPRGRRQRQGLRHTGRFPLRIQPGDEGVSDGARSQLGRDPLAEIMLSYESQNRRTRLRKTR